jgi:tripartite-type tricarboxylate transporter receptor subunit TctC
VRKAEGSADELHIDAMLQLGPHAVSGVAREPSLPNVPTVGESYPGFALVGWLMISAPAGTPKAAIEGMNRAFDKVLKSPETQEWMSRNGSHNAGSAGTLPELEAFVRSEIDVWGKAVKAIGLQPE